MPFQQMNKQSTKQTKTGIHVHLTLQIPQHLRGFGVHYVTKISYTCTQWWHFVQSRTTCYSSH